MMADRAESNAGVNAVVANSSATRAHSGTPGRAMTVTRTARAASQPTMTERRGCRSAASARNRPPITHGT